MTETYLEGGNDVVTSFLDKETTWIACGCRVLM